MSDSVHEVARSQPSVGRHCQTDTTVRQFVNEIDSFNEQGKGEASIDWDRVLCSMVALWLRASDIEDMARDLISW